MNSIFSASLRRAARFIAITSALALPALHAADAPAPSSPKPAVNTPVSSIDNGDTWTLDNGIIKATI